MHAQTTGGRVMSVAVEIAADPKQQARRERRVAAAYRGDFAWCVVLEFLRDFGA